MVTIRCLPEREGNVGCFTYQSIHVPLSESYGDGTRVVMRCLGCAVGWDTAKTLVCWFPSKHNNVSDVRQFREYLIYLTRKLRVFGWQCHTLANNESIYRITDSCAVLGSVCVYIVYA